MEKDGLQGNSQIGRNVVEGWMSRIPAQNSRNKGDSKRRRKGNGRKDPVIFAPYIINWVQVFS
jgi:hypothetical protein